MIRVTGLNHAVLFVRDLERSLNFYKTVFGFEEIDRLQEQMAFLRAAGSNNHHDLGLIALGANAAASKPGTVGLYHLAWAVPTIEDLATAAQVLQQTGYLRGASDHGASKSLSAQIQTATNSRSFGAYRAKPGANLNIDQSLDRSISLAS